MAWISGDILAFTNCRKAGVQMKSTIMPSLAFERKWYAMPLGSGMFSTLANGKSADFPASPW